MAKNYWMLVTSPENFQITRNLGFTAQALKGQHPRKVQRVEPGDRILYYIGGDRYFGATATVASKYFEDTTPVWKKEGVSNWKYRIQIRPAIILDEHEVIDARELAPRLEYVRRWAPEDWYIAFAQSNLHLLPKRDFLLVEEEMRKLKANHNRRPRTDPASATGDSSPYFTSTSTC